MTIFYPDISNNNAGLKVEPNTVAVCAKVSEGSSFTDPDYADFKAQAAGVHAFFFAYHWLWRQGLVDITQQARFCYGIVGSSTPLMVDMEVPGAPTVSDCLEFVTAFRAYGGVCTLVYLPHWYWQGNLGSPDLRPLAQAGLHLVSSNYTTYSDTGPGWDPYGGMTPAIWQYTSSYPYGGKDQVDFNAYRGTTDQLAALVCGPLPAAGAAANAEGRLEVFTVRGSGELSHKWQTAPNNGWTSEWVSLGGRVRKAVAAARNADGRLEVFAVGRDDGVLYHKWQTTPNGTRSNWASLSGSQLAGDVAATANADGRLDVFAIGGDSVLYHKWQTTPNGTWSNWVSLGGNQLAGRVAAAANADGRLEVFTIGGDSVLYHKWQTTPNGTWSGWVSLK